MLNVSAFYDPGENNANRKNSRFAAITLRARESALSPSSSQKQQCECQTLFYDVPFDVWCQLASSWHQLLCQLKGKLQNREHICLMAANICWHAVACYDCFGRKGAVFMTIWALTMNKRKKACLVTWFASKRACDFFFIRFESDRSVDI